VQPLAIAVMAKAPVPGLAKTRLVPALGEAGAAALAARLLDHAVAQAVAAALGPVTVWATPDTTHPAFQRLQRQHGVALAVQGPGDIGQRMAAVFAAHGGPLLLMGSDLPGSPPACCNRPPRRWPGTTPCWCRRWTGVTALSACTALRRPCLPAWTGARRRC
jgi:hypothetical protein